MPAPAPAGLPMPQAPEGGEPPMGSSPATSPTPNAGDDAQSMQQASLILDAATELLPKIGATSEMGQLLLQFITKASKIVQPGAVSPAGKQNQMDMAQRQNAQNGQQMSMIRQSAAQQGAAGGAPPQAGQAA